LNIELLYVEDKIKIPDRYTVPESGVENATFKEVLEVVEKYYEEKLSSKQPTRTTT